VITTTTYVHNPTVREEGGVRRLADSDHLVITLGDYGNAITLLATDAEWDAIVHAVNTFRAELKGMTK
jgi:hypothetical protein